MIGCFYDHGRWVALHLQSHPETGDTLVVARLGECPGDADDHDVPWVRGGYGARRTAVRRVVQRGARAVGPRRTGDPESGRPDSNRRSSATQTRRSTRLSYAPDAPEYGSRAPRS
jgi:hypothetical protein